MSITSQTIASVPSMAPMTLDRLQGSVAALSELAGSTGRDTAAGLLQGILRELRAARPAGA